MEEEFRRVRARAKRLCCGDHNAEYFHAKANRRTKRNAIVGLGDREGYDMDEGRDIRGVGSRLCSESIR